MASTTFKFDFSRIPSPPGLLERSSERFRCLSAHDIQVRLFTVFLVRPDVSSSDRTNEEASEGLPASQKAEGGGARVVAANDDASRGVRGETLPTTRRAGSEERLCRRRVARGVGGAFASCATASHDARALLLLLRTAPPPTTTALNGAALRTAPTTMTTAINGAALRTSPPTTTTALNGAALRTAPPTTTTALNGAAAQEVYFNNYGCGLRDTLCLDPIGYTCHGLPIEHGTAREWCGAEPNRARGGGRRWRRFDLTRLVAPPHVI